MRGSFAWNNFWTNTVPIIQVAWDKDMDIELYPYFYIGCNYSIMTVVYFPYIWHQLPRMGFDVNNTHQIMMNPIVHALTDHKQS